MRTIRIYELVITYPEGSSKAEGAWDDGYETSEGYESRWVWKWPVERRFLSRTSALDRAKRLAAMGCTVDVRQSAPISFEEAPAVHFDAQPPIEPDPDFDPTPWLNPEPNDPEGR